MRIGVLSFHFYNVTAEGLATAKVARALRDRGHDVTVFTSLDNPLNGSHRQGSAEGPLAGIKIHRVGPDSDLIPGWWEALDKRARGSVVWDKIGAIPNLAYGCKLEEQAWIKSVSREVIEVWKSEPFDVLHTRLNHAISHLAGLEVTRQIGRLPWCAYFSDPWPHHLYPAPYQFTVGPASRLRLEGILKQILERAGSLIFPSGRLRDHLLSGTRSRFREKAFVASHLTNLWGKVNEPEPDKILKVRHSGFLMRERSIDPMLAGLRKFLADRPEARNQIRIDFAGRYLGNDLPTAPAYLSDVVGFHPYMDPEAIWDWLQDADVFLLVEAKMKEGIFLPSKLADYAGGGRPMLALSPAKGVVADFLREGGGIIVEPDDVPGISQALGRLFDLWRTGELGRLAPTSEQLRKVSPDEIIPIYEQAFQFAIDATG